MSIPHRYQIAFGVWVFSAWVFGIPPVVDEKRGEEGMPADEKVVAATTYPGRESDAPWRAAAKKRIDEIRKGPLTIEVVDQNGSPLAGVPVKVEMQRHAFGFGTAVNVFMLGGEEDDFPYARRRREKAPVACSWQDAGEYREIVAKYFNRVTFDEALRPHVWKLQTGENPVYQHQFKVLTENAIPWLQARNIRVRGHYLGWGAMDFTPLQKNFVGNPEGHRKWLWAHMADVLGRTAGSVDEWDTINHIAGWGKTYESEYNGLEIHAEILREARRLAPEVTQTINEGQVLPSDKRREPYKRIIRYLNECGEKPDVVGFMGHFGITTLTPPEELLTLYDEFAALAPRLQLSELDVETADDEQLQADYLRDVLIASFSHPNIENIVQWGVWENQHWKPRAALWRADWTIKPAGEAFVNLVSKEWWTNESVKSDRDGKCVVRGFLGEYCITVGRGGKQVTEVVSLGREGLSLRLVVE